ncbi:LLM class flavin-dependent oxidoreductase [Streptomyces sp. B21-108]|nr:LLM class flavin-dependent oxidoreductase [Streptomyces sp. LUP47B]
MGFAAGGILDGKSATQVLDLVQSTDELGYDLFTMTDHLHTEQPTPEPRTLLSWLAGKTERIEFAPTVLGLPYREPPVLAKMAGTLDQVSGGRLVLGLGADGFDQEFAAFSLTVRSNARKVAAQREAIEIMRGLWSGEPTWYGGQDFTVTEARISLPPAHPRSGWVPAGRRHWR